MRQLLTSVLILWFAIPEIMAQSDFRDGYIIKNNNDTIYGLIDYRGNKANAKRCLYRKDINSDTQVFTPDEIMAYRFIDSKYYVSRHINTASDERKQLFLEYLINGIVDIFYYRDETGEHYLVSSENDSIYVLDNKEKEIILDNTRYSVESQAYIGVLKAFFSESPSVFQRVENLHLGHKSLINIAQDYHNEVCHDEECIVYEKRLPKFKNTFGILLGMNDMTVSHIGEFPDILYYMRDSRFKSTISPTVGLYYKINMPYINERLYFQYELFYSRVHLTMQNSTVNLASYMKYINDLTLKQNVINTHGIIKYEFPTGKIRPTFHAGGFARYAITSEYERNLAIEYSWGDIFRTLQTNDNPFSKYDYGISCGAGLKGHYFGGRELFFDIRYQRGFGLMQGLHTNLFLFHFGLQIGK